jgi:hypothetical protein
MDEKAVHRVKARLTISAATRLALAFGLAGSVPVFFLSLLVSAPDWEPGEAAAAAAFASGLFAAFGYVVAFYLRLICWVREAFLIERRVQALHHLRHAGGLCVVLLGFFLAALYLRYEVVPTGMRGRLHYFLVWDRWTGDVKVEARLRSVRDEAETMSVAY